MPFWRSASRVLINLTNRGVTPAFADGCSLPFEVGELGPKGVMMLFFYRKAMTHHV